MQTFDAITLTPEQQQQLLDDVAYLQNANFFNGIRRGIERSGGECTPGYTDDALSIWQDKEPIARIYALLGRDADANL